jgi:hypothetical protein
VTRGVLVVTFVLASAACAACAASEPSPEPDVPEPAEPEPVSAAHAEGVETDAPCPAPPRLTWWRTNPVEPDPVPFDGWFGLDLISAPTSHLFATVEAEGTWVADATITTDGYGLPVLETVRLRVLPDLPFSVGLTWPTDAPSQASDVDLCTATSRLALTFTPVGGGGDCAYATTLPFHLEPGRAPADVCPRYLADEAELQWIRDRIAAGR